MVKQPLLREGQCHISVAAGKSCEQQEDGCFSADTGMRAALCRDSEQALSLLRVTVRAREELVFSGGGWTSTWVPVRPAGVGPALTLRE